MNYILKDSILCPTVYKIVQKCDELQHHELDQSNNSIFSDNYSSTTSENLNNSHNFDHNLINEYSNECKLEFGKPPMFPKIQKNGTINKFNTNHKDLSILDHQHLSRNCDHLNGDKALTKIAQSYIRLIGSKKKENDQLLLFPSAKILLQKERRRSICHNSENVSLFSNKNLNYSKSHDSLHFSKNGLLNSKLFKAILMKTKSNKNHKYRIIVSKAQDISCKEKLVILKPHLRRMNLKLHPHTMSIKRLSERARYRLYHEKNEQESTKMDYLQIPKVNECHLLDV